MFWIVIAILFVGYLIYWAIDRNTQVNALTAQLKLRQNELNMPLTVEDQISRLTQRTKEKEAKIKSDIENELKDCQKELEEVNSNKQSTEYEIDLAQRKAKFAKDESVSLKKWVNINTALCERYRHDHAKLIEQLEDWNTCFDISIGGNDMEQEQYWSAVSSGKSASSIRPSDDQLRIRNLEARARILKRLKQEDIEPKFRLEMEKIFSEVKKQIEKA